MKTIPSYSDPLKSAAKVRHYRRPGRHSVSNVRTAKMRVEGYWRGGGVSTDCLMLFLSYAQAMRQQNIIGLYSDLVFGQLDLIIEGRHVR